MVARQRVGKGIGERVTAEEAFWNLEVELARDGIFLVILFFAIKLSHFFSSSIAFSKQTRYTTEHSQVN